MSLLYISCKHTFTMLCLLELRLFASKSCCCCGVCCDQSDTLFLYWLGFSGVVAEMEEGAGDDWLLPLRYEKFKP